MRNLLSVVAFLFGWIVLAGTSGTYASDTQSFAGSGSCAGCHPAETKAWAASDHFWALREPDSNSVLGDFQDAHFTHNGVTSRFFTKDGQYFVETDGSDGKLTQYQVRYTVGVRPLQQYLVDTGQGRLQTLDIAWDTQERKWFHLYPDQDVGSGNGMHWTGSYKNWQARCAECHQTGFDKGYDLKARTYKSHWAELTVSCESCHGPSTAHVETAGAAKKSAAASILPTAAGKLGPGQQAGELAVCGPCHARREAFSQKSAQVGSKFGDHYNLALLTPDLYFSDGQQNAEVYILGSFLQSKMKAKGVTCSNCHEPHGGKLIADGNAVCTQCHSEAGRTEFPSLVRKTYDDETHHHHKPGTDGAMCVNCHMPNRTYMVNDKRRDHFFRRPDPLQAKAAGAPDACTGCHEDKTKDWAAERIADWFPGPSHEWQDRSAFIAFNTGDRSANTLESLAAYARDIDRPAIVRATALEMLRDTANSSIRESLMPLLKDDDDVVRASAVRMQRSAEAAAKAAVLSPLLSDISRNVRQAAAGELAAGQQEVMSPSTHEALKAAIAEYMDSRAANADMPESHMAMAGLALSLRNWNAAEAAFNEASSMDPQLVEAWIMLIRLKAALGDPQGAEQYAEKGLSHQPNSIPLLFERADLEAGRGNGKKAIDWYRRIVTIDPKQSDAWSAMASAALQAHDSNVALDATRKLMELQPANADAYVIAAIAHYMRQELDLARENARTALRLNPGVRLPDELANLLRGQ